MLCSNDFRGEPHLLSRALPEPACYSFADT
jgi:hypothetical protein